LVRGFGYGFLHALVVSKRALAIAVKNNSTEEPSTRSHERLWAGASYNGRDEVRP
jgi:hypothetical protein